MLRAPIHRWWNNLKSKTWKWEETYSTEPTTKLLEILHEVVPNTRSLRQPLYGLHFLFNVQSNDHLGSDGYDNYQAPVNEEGRELFSRRMWVSGSLDYPGKHPSIGENISCEERVKSVRCLGPNTFVSIARRFMRGSENVMNETRTLMYTNEMFRGEKTSTREHTTNSTPKGERIVFTQEQMMRYSTLTRNFHKIHLDPEHCKAENLDNVVVSGPFLVSTMLHYFMGQYPDMEVKSFNYRNSGPCYVGEQVDISIEKMPSGYGIEMSSDGRLACKGILGVYDK